MTQLAVQSHQTSAHQASSHQTPLHKTSSHKKTPQLRGFLSSHSGLRGRTDHDVARLLDIKAVSIHHFGPRTRKVFHEALPTLVKSVKLHYGAQFRIGSEDEIELCRGPFQITTLSITALKDIARLGTAPMQYSYRADSRRSHCSILLGDRSERLGHCRRRWRS